MTLREVWRAANVWLDRHIFKITLAALGAAFFFVFFSDRIVYTIPAGHAGVVWRPFSGGTRVDRVYPEGVRLIWPWNLLTIYDVRYQIIDQEFRAVDSAGLEFVVDVSTRVRLVREQLGRLHQLVGPMYASVVIVPEVGGLARGVMAKYTAEEVYSRRREAVQEEILQRVHSEMSLRRRPGAPLIEIEEVLIRQIILPPIVATAIQEKVRQYHLDQEWVFRLSREAKESERKAIEAEGIRRFQDTVSRGISDSYLKWKGIDATLKLAESPNAKVVIFGSGPQGLPVILGTDRTGPTALPGEAQRSDRPAELQSARPATGDDLIGLAPPLPTQKPESSTVIKAPSPSAPGPASVVRPPEPPAPPAGTSGITTFLSWLFGRGR